MESKKKKKKGHEEPRDKTGIKILCPFVFVIYASSFSLLKKFLMVSLMKFPIVTIYPVSSECLFTESIAVSET